MKPIRRKVLVACNFADTLLKRIKLFEALSINNDVYVFTPQITRNDIRVKLESLGLTIYEGELETSNI
jgi:hypothetical protein